MEKSQSFLGDSVGGDFVSLVGVLMLTYYFRGIHEVILFVVGLFFVGTLLLYIFKKKIW